MTIEQARKTLKKQKSPSVIYFADNGCGDGKKEYFVCYARALKNVKEQVAEMNSTDGVVEVIEQNY